MNLYSNPGSLSALWRRRLEMALEAGETPVLALGWDTLHPDSAFPLAALHRLARIRPGVVQPWIVAGGEGDLWLLGATQWQKERRAGPLYGGNDSATFAATLTLAESVRTGGGAPLPGGMGWMLTPTAAPGCARSEGEYLPFALAADEFSPLPAADAPSDWIEQLAGWGVALLALGLLVVGLII
ncbi:MAG: hypothetical protein HY328_06000 [Chloroflexi bacterium]|nr:hypothetical protein [Chloroflexota bacterium]